MTSLSPVDAFKHTLLSQEILLNKDSDLSSLLEGNNYKV